MSDPKLIEAQLALSEIVAGMTIVVPKRSSLMEGLPIFRQRTTSPDAEARRRMIAEDQANAFRRSLIDEGRLIAEAQMQSDTIAVHIQAHLAYLTRGGQGR